MNSYNEGHFRCHCRSADSHTSLPQKKGFAWEVLRVQIEHTKTCSTSLKGDTWIPICSMITRYAPGDVWWSSSLQQGIYSGLLSIWREGMRSHRDALNKPWVALHSRELPHRLRLLRSNPSWFCWFGIPRNAKNQKYWTWYVGNTKPKGELKHIYIYITRTLSYMLYAYVLHMKTPNQSAVCHEFSQPSTLQGHCLVCIWTWIWQLVRGAQVNQMDPKIDSWLGKPTQKRHMFNKNGWYSFSILQDFFFLKVVQGLKHSHVTWNRRKKRLYTQIFSTIFFSSVEPSCLVADSLKKSLVENLPPTN